MRVAPRLPMLVGAAALIGLMVVLAALQYHWLGRISEAERESRRSTLSGRAAAFAADVDKELTLAYVLFQLEPLLDTPMLGENLASRVAGRYDRWQASSRFPRLIRTCLVATRNENGTSSLQRFNPDTKLVEPAAWPSELEALRREIAQSSDETTNVGGSRGNGTGTLFVRRLPGPLWDEVPALLIPMPLLLLGSSDGAPLRRSPAISYTVLVLDRGYIEREMLPALAGEHLRGLGDGVNYEGAVVSIAGHRLIYRSAAGFAPRADAQVDATADLFQVRTQDFPNIAADVKRFTLSVPSPGGHLTAAAPEASERPGADRQAHEAHGIFFRETAPRATTFDQATRLRERAIVASVAGTFTRSAGAAPRWRILVKHPSGSLEAAVTSTRRRNLLVSSTILAVLGASMALLVLSARRSQEVARQQMEFVAAVSHELRTPLAVIRSAGDNLADGVIGDVDQVKKYGNLVRHEGRRLSEMVEQILEFAGIQSGQRRFEPRPVDVAALVDAVLSASAALIEDGRITVERDIPSDLPPVRGDEAALRRVVQNLVGNAIKYGGDHRWIGLRACRADREIQFTVADRGVGIAASEQTRIFEPFYRAADVVAAQIQGAGLGLSLVKRIVDAHGGRVSVKSAPGAGSAFTVHLPQADPEPISGADPRPAEAPRYT